MIKHIIVFWALIASTVSLQAQSVQIDAKLDTSVILIGDQIKLHIEVEKHNDVRVKFPQWENALTPQIEIVNTFPIDSATVSAQVTRFTQDVLITSFDSGRHEIPAIEIVISVKNQTDTLRTRPLSLEVCMVPTDTLTHIADIKPVYDLPIGWADIWPWLLRIGLALLVIALIALMVYVAVRKSRNQPLFYTPKPVLPPHIEALRELDRLRADKLWQNNQVKDYYTRLSDIVRTYIHRRFGVAAMEMTSDEALAGLKAIGFEDNNLTDRLRGMFGLADMVKFAKMSPLPDENETALLDSYLFVNNTKIEESHHDLSTNDTDTEHVNASDVSAEELFKSINVKIS